MRMDPGIILSGQGFDLVNTLGRASQAAGVTNQTQRANHLAQLYRDHGPGIMAGEQNALNMLAQHSPQEALGIQQTRQGMDVQMEQLGIQRRAAKEATQRHFLDVKAKGLAIDAAEIERDILAANQAAVRLYYAQTPEEFDAIVGQLKGFEFLKGQFDRKVEAVATIKGGVDGLMELLQGQQPEYGINEETGQFYDKNNPGGGAFDIPGYTIPQNVPLVDMSGMQFGVGGDQGPAGSLPPSNPNPPTGAQEAFGLEGWLKSGANNVTDFLGLGEAFPNAAEQKRFFKNLEEDMLVGLSQAYGRQPAMQLMERLRKLLPNAGTTEGASAAFGELVQMENRFKSDLDSVERTLVTNPRMNQSDRQELLSRREGLMSVLGRIEEARMRFARPTAGQGEVSPEDEALINKYLKQ